MKPISNARIILIALVALASIWLAIPTARYYLHLRHAPETTGPRPIADTPRPAESDVEAIVQWEQRNPVAVAWRQANPDYLTWEAESVRRRERAIPLGLDLRGGVDVMVALDEEASIANEVTKLKENLQRDLDAEKLSVQFIEAGDLTELTLRVADPADAQSVANLINSQWGGLIDSEVSAADLQADGATFGLDIAVLNEELRRTLEGAMNAIRDRIDSLGVTQPKIALQGERIRVQVPGEESPDRIINLVIQPAKVDFHLVVENMEQYLGPDGRVPPGSLLPPGTDVFPGKLVEDFDQTTQEFVYREQDFVLMKRPELTGADLRSARVTFVATDIQNPVQVGLDFKPDGTRRFADLTTKYQNAIPPRQIAILLDGAVRSAPTIDEPILEGRAVIRGGFTDQEATDLSQILKAGSLPAPLKVVSKRTVGATLGAQSIQSGVTALLWGSLIVALFMLVYYGTAGVIAIVALGFNILIILAIMALSRATLTLSGIGGILLTVGMAVDANVLIYERIREEIAGGKPLRQAIGTGFNRAITVILDSNLTTLMTAMVLLQFTEGSVFGFALTMSFGLLANLFTGLTVTYTLCALWFGWRGELSLGKLAIFPNANFDFISCRRASLALSTLVFVGGIIAVMSQGGLKYSVDFAGGLSADVEFSQPVTEPELRALLAENNLGGTVTRVVNRENGFIIDIPLVTPPGSKDGDPQATEAALTAALETAHAGNYTKLGAEIFGSQIGQEFSQLAITVVLLASFAILLYLWFRFELFFGVAAVVALIHDLTIVLVLASLWGVEISLDEVAALMVLLGFSVNDTIVIFDRIRENTRTVFGKSFKEQCNLAMNQSLSRSIITSGTLLMASLMLLFFGGQGLAPFAKIITLGCIVGTYSSDFLATPLVYLWNEYRGNRLQQQLSDRRKKRIEAAKPVRGGAAR
jgi:SecD/SecF fusion protein